MARNVGQMDRNARIVLGVILGLAGIGGYVGAVPLAWLGFGQALAGVVFVVLGVILLVTGLLNTCPIYAILGMNTSR